LVLLLLVLIAAGLAVPFILEQRKRSNRAHCEYNLACLGKAIHEYDKQNGFLPPARIADDYATWAVLITPYMEKRRANDKEHPLVGWEVGNRYADQLPAVREAWLKEMFCPSRQRGGPLSTQGDGDPLLPGAVGDYACVSGDGREVCPWTGAKANGPMVLGEVLKVENGVILQWQSRTRLDADTSLKRGLSTTLLIGEKHVPFEAWGRADEGDGCIYNGGHPASSARVAGLGFGLAQTPSAPFSDNFGGYHRDVCLFLQADLALRPVSIHVSEEILGRMMVRDDE
jgi:hypothetical protein